ncbi:MAG: CPBP family intramembrane glutamic endopeptidase [Bacillota bacterium]|nr:CPBP family intramembrane glutamic endopeptidase [Bacillota bacterium]
MDGQEPYAAASWQAEPDPILPGSKNRFRVRTVLIPLLFLGLHWLAINLTATFYIVVYAFVQDGAVNPLDLLGDLDKMTQVLNEQYPAISVIYSALLIPLYILYLYLQKRQDSRTVWLNRAEGRQLFPALAITVGLLGLINLWFNLLTWLSESNQLVDRLMQEYIEVAGAFSPVIGYFWLILGISILTPIAEELLFRGIIQGELRKAMPEWAAVVIQGVIFAAFHWQPIQISYVLLPGLLLGLLYAWTRSLWVPIAMHIVFNFLGSVLPALIGEDEVLAQIVGISELVFIVIGILCLIYLYHTRRTQQEPAAAQ